MTLRFLSRGEIAEHLGVTLGTVKQYASFPEPDVIVGRNQGWAVETVDQWRHSREAVRAAGRALRAGQEPAQSVPSVDCGLGGDLRPVPDDSSGREPTSLSAAPLSGAGPEAPHRIGGSGIDMTTTNTCTCETPLAVSGGFGRCGYCSGALPGVPVPAAMPDPNPDIYDPTAPPPRGVDRRGRGA